MNDLLSRYIARQLATAFALATGAVTFVVLFTQSFRLLSLVIENSSTTLIFLQLLLLSAITFLPLIMPLGLGAAVAFVYNRMHSDNELIVMRSAGMNIWQLVKPAVFLATAAFTACLALTLWISPYAHRNLVSLRYEMRDSYAVFLSNPGNFNDLSDGITFYANKRGAGGTLQGVLIHDVRKPDTPVTTMADSGQVVSTNGLDKMIIFNGKRQELDRTTGKLSELSFDQYVLDLDALRSTSKKRLPDHGEQTLAELLNPSDEMLKARGPISRFNGELHSRLATPLLSFSYTMLALTGIFAGAFNRRGMAARLAISAICIIAAQAIFMTINSLVARNEALTFALYVVAIAPAPIGLAIISKEIFHKKRPKRRAHA